MAITLRGGTSAGTGASTALTSYTINVPGGTVANDFILLYVITRGANPVSTPTGFTAITATVFSSTQGQLFYKIADGTEGSTFTISWTGANDSEAVCVSYTGVNMTTPFDPSAPANSGTSSTGAFSFVGPTTTVNGDMLVWLAGEKNAVAGVAPGTFGQPTGFTVEVAQLNTTTAANPNIGIIAADMTQTIAGAVGTITGTDSLSTDHCISVVACLQPAAATAPLPSDVPRRVRRFPFPRRRTSSTAIFPQIVITPHPVPPQPPRRLLPIAWRPKAKPRFAQPPTGPKFNGSYPVPPQPPTPARHGWLPRARARQAQPVPPQVVVLTTQALPPQPQRRRTIPTFRRGRARSTTVITVQALLPQQPSRDRLTPPLRRRPTATAVVTVRVQQPPQPARDRLIPFPRRRTVSAQPPLSTVVTVTAQALPPQPGRPARAAWLPRSKARQAQPVPAQQTIVLHPAPPQPGRPVRAPWLPRAKARRAEPVWPQQIVVLHPAPPQPARDRLLPPLLRRSRSAQPVSTQIVVTAQALPPQPIRRRRPWWLPRSRAKRYEPAWPQGVQSAVFTIGTLTTGDQGTGAASTSAAAVTVTVTTDKPLATQTTNTQRTGGPS